MVIVSMAFVLSFMFFRAGISEFLGARDRASRLLMDYILGFAPGMLFANVSAFLLSLTAYNNDIGISYIAAVVLFGGDVLADILLVAPLGIFGIGLASSISSAVVFAILIPGFLKSSKTIHFECGHMETGLLLESVKRGLPVLLFNAGLIMKNSLLNYSLVKASGNSGIAVVNVLVAVCGITGTVSGGFVNAYTILVSLYYGGEDWDGLLDLFNIAFLSGFICNVVMTAAATVFAGLWSGVFFNTGTDIWFMAKRMFMFGFWFLPLNLIFSLIMNTYKAQGKMKLVDIMTFVEVGIVGMIAFLLVPVLGTDAAWMANTWGDILCLVIILVTLFILYKKISLGIPDILRLEDDFGANSEQFVEYEITDMADVSAASESVMDFCKKSGVDSRRSFLASLCVEELTRNIIQHGGIKRIIIMWMYAW